MKYIRTKDERIIDLKKGWTRVELECVNAETCEIKKDICYQRNWFELYGDTCEYKTECISHNNQVLNQADTIEKLCDTFVITNHGTDSNFLMEDFEVVKENFKDNAIIFGAIWTDKGLIYVAKLNENGELELL